jgi:hypothetical protein
MLQTILRAPRTAEDIAQGARLAKMQGREIGPSDVAKVLTEAGLKYVIVGAHAANGYNGRPRATVDVDVVVQFPKKAARAIAGAFPKLQMRDTPVVIRFMDGDQEAIDLMKPTGSKLWARLLKDAREVKVDRKLIRIPSVEGVLAAKFASMISPLRRLADRQQDAADFLRIVDANPKIDAKVLQEMGDLVYPDGGTQLVKYVSDARAGRTLEI